MAISSDAEAIFDTEIAKHGRKRRPEALSAFQRATFAEVTPVVFRFLPPPHPHVFAIEETAREAFCFEVGNESFIAISDGLTFVLVDTFLRMLALPTTFPDVGDPTKETLHGAIQPPPIDLMSVVYREAEHRKVEPKCPERKRYALFLYATAMAMVVAHECAHIYNGHLALLAKEGGRPSRPWFEIRGSSPSPFTWMEHQALEMDADTFASRVTLQTALDHAKEFLKNPTGTTRGLRSLEDAIRAWEVATHTLFHWFYGTSVIGDPPEDLSHPPATMRMMNNFVQALQDASTGLGADVGLERILRETGGPTFVLVERAYSAISGTNFDKTGFEQAMRQAWRVVKYADAWADLHPRLLPLAKRKLVDPQRDAIERRAARLGQ